MRKNKGITLIALVITMIILLILASISVAVLSGENSILRKTGEAKGGAEVSNEQDIINLTTTTVMNNNAFGKLVPEELKTELETNYGNMIDSVNILGENVQITFKSGRSYNVNSDGSQGELRKPEIKVGTTNLKDASDLSTLYGETTDFTSINGITWQLFYSDTNNIYLIASDYVPHSTLSRELIKSTHADYRARFATYEDPIYTGTIIENTPWSNGADSSTITGNAQTNTYLKWVNSNVVTTRNNPNMKAVAYMMDTSRWSNFAGNVLGAYAIGGPTLEMFALSYNAKHSTNQLGTYETVDSTNAGSKGYMVKIGTDSWANYASGLDTSLDNMWIKTSNSKANAMWMASPSSRDPYYIVSAGYTGWVYFHGINEDRIWLPSISNSSEIKSSIIKNKFKISLTNCKLFAIGQALFFMVQ